MGPDPGNTVKRYRDAGLEFHAPKDWLIVVSRIFRMNPPPGSKNLDLFKAAYRKFKTYFLAPGAVKADGSQLRPIPELGIYKSSVLFRHVEEIGENDMDAVVLGTGQGER